MTLPPDVAALYPFTPKKFTTPAGAQMSFLDEGPRSDEAVLMLHGNPTWSFFYRDLVKALAPHMRCIVPDHIGMGLSEKPENYPYTLAQRMADVAALVDSLGLKKVHLVVHDWGGAIGFGWATRNPDSVGRIVILNTAAFLSARIPTRITLCRASWLGKLIVRGFNGFAGPAAWMSVHARKLTPAEKRGFLFPYDTWAHRVAVHRFVTDIPMEPDHPTRPVLAETERLLPLLADRPKLIVWGGRDFCFNDHFLARWQEIYPEAKVTRYADAGHYVLEDAGEPARDEIVRHLLG